MPDKLPVGPYRTIEIDDGAQAPFYIIPFDEQGICQGPLTRDQVLTAFQNGNYTNVFLFSHGCNSNWKAATDLYNSFLTVMLRLLFEIKVDSKDLRFPGVIFAKHANITLGNLVTQFQPSSYKG